MDLATTSAEAEMKAIQKYIQERIDYLKETGLAPDLAKLEAQVEGNFERLPWHSTRSGQGEIVFKSDVPAWVQSYPDIGIGTVVKGHLYKLFPTGILWRRTQ